MRKIKGYILKWKAKGKDIWYVHVRHLNGNISDTNKYGSRGGRNKKVKSLLKLFKGFKPVSREEYRKMKRK